MVGDEQKHPITDFDFAIGSTSSPHSYEFTPNLLKHPDGRLGLDLDELDKIRAKHAGANVLWICAPEIYEIDETLPETFFSYAYGALTLDTNNKQLKVKNSAVQMTDKPYRLLELVMSNPGVLYTKEEIKRWVKHDGEIVNVETTTDAALEIWVSRARKALGEFRTLLKTRWSNGSRLDGYYFDNEDLHEIDLIKGVLKLNLQKSQLLSESDIFDLTPNQLDLLILFWAAPDTTIADSLIIGYLMESNEDYSADDLKAEILHLTSLIKNYGGEIKHIPNKGYRWNAVD